MVQTKIKTNRRLLLPSPEITISWRSRWTPKGFQERYSGDTSSPTANAASHKLTEALGMADDMIAFSVDFSAAFFQSDVMEMIDPGRKLWIEVPEGDPAFDPAVKKARLLKTAG